MAGERLAHRTRMVHPRRHALIECRITAPIVCALARGLRCRDEEWHFSCNPRADVRDTESVASDADGFSILCEVEPATTPDLRRVRRQIVAFDGVTDLFLIPDNHIGRATVSRIAVAREVADLGGRAVDG